jgi:hypothetical protein
MGPAIADDGELGTARSIHTRNNTNCRQNR